MPLDEAKWTFWYLQDLAEAFEARMRAHGMTWVTMGNTTRLDIGDYVYYFAFNLNPAQLDDPTDQRVDEREYK